MSAKPGCRPIADARSDRTPASRPTRPSSGKIRSDEVIKNSFSHFVRRSARSVPPVPRSLQIPRSISAIVTADRYKVSAWRRNQSTNSGFGANLPGVSYESADVSSRYPELKDQPRAAEFDHAQTRHRRERTAVDRRGKACPRDRAVARPRARSSRTDTSKKASSALPARGPLTFIFPYSYIAIWKLKNLTRTDLAGLFLPLPIRRDERSWSALHREMRPFRNSWLRSRSASRRFPSI